MSWNSKMRPWHWHWCDNDLIQSLMNEHYARTPVLNPTLLKAVSILDWQYETMGSCAVLSYWWLTVWFLAVKGLVGVGISFKLRYSMALWS